MGGGDELLGVGAGTLFESGAERVGPLERPAPEPHLSFAALQGSFPLCIGGAHGHAGLPSSNVNEIALVAVKLVVPRATMGGRCEPVRRFWRCWLPASWCAACQRCG